MTLSSPSCSGHAPPSVAAGEDGTPRPDDSAPLVLEATPLAVRQALAEMRARFSPASSGPDTLGMAETVLAEVLNNIVEHAYGRDGAGVIELRMQRDHGRLRVEVRDHGGPMPNGALPTGALPSADTSDDGPPEGGFGWFLIRALARDLSYSRENGQNRLCFYVPLIEG